MKESLFDIFQRHRDCFDNRKDPTIEEQQANPEARQLMAERFRERKQAANEYASSLIPLGNDWIEAVKYEVDYLTKNSHLPPSLYFNKAEREAYRDGVEHFLLNVAGALREHGKEKFLNGEYFDPVTLYRFGMLYMNWEEPQTGLAEDEAKQIAKDMKQRYSQVYCFPDLFSMFPTTYTVLGYKAQASTPAQVQNKADGSEKGTGMGNNTTANPETPPATQEKPKVAVMQPYTRKTPGRHAGEFSKTIADTYKDKADIIQKHTGIALASMTDPKAVIALFIVYFRNGILKELPTYWQAMRLLDIEAATNREKAKLCPFGSYQGYDRESRIYFAEDNLSLNETDSKRDNEISSFIQGANSIYIALHAKLIQEPTEQARQGA